MGDGWRDAVQRASRGQGFLEYSLIFLCVVLVVFGALLLVGPMITSLIAPIAPAL